MFKIGNINNARFCLAVLMIAYFNTILKIFHKNGIYTLADLKAFAEKWYGTEDKGKYRSPKNALYKFVAYHFLNGEITYDRIVPSELGLGSEIYNHFNIPGYDHYNYFVTKHGKLMKVVKPLSTTESKNIYIKIPLYTSI